MRHGKKFNHLGRKANHRKSMLANMACSLIQYKRIKTTLAKGKALRKYVEPLITKSKNDTTHSRRIVFSYLKQKEAITELFGDIASRISERDGGYIRILKTGNRLGDNAEMCIVELVDYNDSYTTDKPKKKTKSRRSRGVKKTLDSSTTPEDSSSDEAVKVSEEKDSSTTPEDSSSDEAVKVSEEKDSSTKPEDSSSDEAVKVSDKEESSEEKQEEKQEENAQREEQKGE